MSTPDTTSALLGLLLMGDGLHNSDWGQKTNANLQIIESAIREICPIAEAREFYGTALPSTNWLWANGQAVKRSDYPGLYAAIGTTYGAGDGTTTFNVPDRREVVAMGASTMGGAAARGMLATVRNLGVTFGEELHTLSSGEMPTHNHNVYDPGHSHGVADGGHAHGVADPGHAHTEIASANQNSNLISNGSGFRCNAGANAQPTSASGTGIGIYASNANISIYGSGTGISIYNAGGGGPHNNMQPTIACNVIIRAK